MRERRSNSSANIAGYTTLRDLATLKQKNIISRSISKLQQFKTKYDQPFLEKRDNTEKVRENEEEEQFNLNMYQSDFSKRSYTLCEDTLFHMHVFTQIYKDNPRVKTILAKLHGWDETLDQLLFPNKRDLKIDYSASQVHQRLGFRFKSFKVRNIYNKLRLFLGQLIALNKKQQQLQGRFMKARIGNQLSKLSKEMLTILASKESSNRHKYIDEIVKTHQLMLQSKIKIKNKVDSVTELKQNFGNLDINKFYLREEQSINDIQKYFTSFPLARQSRPHK